MMDAATLSNILSWSIQVAAITVVAALVPLVLHVDAPAIRHGWWRAVLLSCLLLPILQPWQALSTFPIDVAPLDMTPTLTGSGKATLNASGSASLLSQSWQRTWPAAVGVVLVAGALVRLLWLAGGLFRLRRLRAAGSAADVTDGHRELTALTAAGAEIRYVPVIGQPMTFGIRRPVVLLPESLRTLPDPIQRAVLAHELWHVRRRDWLWILAEETVRSVLWFHPAIGYLVSRVQSSREEVVDELTVLVTNARRSYIEALLAFADEPPLFAAAPFARRRHLFQRMLLISREAVMSSRRIVASTAVMTLAVVLTGWYGVAAFPLTSSSSAGSQFELRTLPVTGQFQNASLRNVLAFMGKHAGVTFSYDQTFVDRTVTIEFRNTSFLNALDRVLDASGYSYRAMSPTSFLIVKHNAAAGQQAPPRDLRPGQAAPPTNREVELQKAIDAGTVTKLEDYADLAKMQERRGALAEAESTLLAARRVAELSSGAVSLLAGFYLRTNRFDQAIALLEDLAAADPTNPKASPDGSDLLLGEGVQGSLPDIQAEDRVPPGRNQRDRSSTFLRSGIRGSADLQEHPPPDAGQPGDRQDAAGSADCRGGCAPKQGDGAEQGARRRCRWCPRRSARRCQWRSRRRSRRRHTKGPIRHAAATATSTTTRASSRSRRPGGSQSRRQHRAAHEGQRRQAGLSAGGDGCESPGCRHSRSGHRQRRGRAVRESAAVDPDTGRSRSSSRRTMEVRADASERRCRFLSS